MGSSPLKRVEIKKSVVTHSTWSTLQISNGGLNSGRKNTYEDFFFNEEVIIQDRKEERYLLVLNILSSINFAREL